jgi:hypothetical protein
LIFIEIDIEHLLKHLLSQAVKSGKIGANMALAHNALWFMQPFQIFSTLGSAVNFGKVPPTDRGNCQSIIQSTN